MSDSEISDQRLIKGTRTRRTIARHAADVASVEGLTGLSIGRLATDLGLSKSGVATLFGTKERLQVAAVESAREVFIDRVIRPVLKEKRGLPRLRKLIDSWMDYASEPVFPGGCFRAATMSEFDSRPGPVRDAIVKDRDDWLGLLAEEISIAVDAGELDLDPALTAFHIDAVLSAANTAFRLGDDRAERNARQVLGAILDAR